MSDFIVVIPARIGSTRLPEKMLQPIGERPMIAHVIENAQKSQARAVYVATDDDRIAQLAESEGAKPWMTSPHHSSGSLRVAELLEALNIGPETIVVGLQGDEPMLPSHAIDALAKDFASNPTEMATLSVPLRQQEDYESPHCVKVLTNAQGYALYFSRSPIPYDRSGTLEEALRGGQRWVARHVGIYAYSSAYLLRYARYQPTSLEVIESLEQLRALYYGDRIHVCHLEEDIPLGVDTLEDLERVRGLMRAAL